MKEQEQPLDFFEAVLERVQPLLYAYILSLVADRSDAKDVLQDTNRVIMSKVGELRQADRFTAWSYRIAYFQSLSFLKKRRSESSRFSVTLLENIAAASEGARDRSEQAFKHLEECLDRLQEKSRLIVSDYYYRDLPIKEIAQRRGMQTNHVAQVLFRSRKALHDCIARKETTDDE